MRLPALILCYFLLLSPVFAECSGNLMTEKVYAAPVCVPSNPQRIVILDPFHNLGMAMELGLPVAAAPLHGLQDSELRAIAETASIADLGDFKQPSLERIVSIQPDLIIGNASSHAQIHMVTSRIAPVLLVEDMDWKDHFRLLARATGRDAVAEEALAGYSERITSIRERIGNIKVSVIRIAADGFILYPDGPNAFGPYAVLRDAGVKRTAIETVTDATPFKRLDWEELAALDSDVLLYFAADGYDPALHDRLAASIIVHPLWQMLPAVKAGRVHRVDRVTWMGFGGVASAHEILNEVERLVLKAP